MAVQDYNYDAAQRQLNTWTWSVSSELEGDVSTSCYEHVGAFWDYSYVYQVKPECRCFKIPVHAIYHQAYYTRVIRDEKP